MAERNAPGGRSMRCAVATAVLALALAAPASADQTQAARPGPIDIRLLDGRVLKAADLRGRVVVKMFWASWSPASVTAELEPRLRHGARRPRPPARLACARRARRDRALDRRERACSPRVGAGARLSHAGGDALRRCLRPFRPCRVDPGVCVDRPQRHGPRPRRRPGRSRVSPGEGRGPARGACAHQAERALSSARAWRAWPGGGLSCLAAVPSAAGDRAVCSMGDSPAPGRRRAARCAPRRTRRRLGCARQGASPPRGIVRRRYPALPLHCSPPP